MDNMQVPAQPEVPGNSVGNSLSDVSVNPEYSERVSRLFIFRGLWIFIMMWPLYFWAIWASIVMILHFFFMLILGKRHKTLWESTARFFRHVIKWQYYLKGLTDKRPKFIED